MFIFIPGHVINTERIVLMRPHPTEAGFLVIFSDNDRVTVDVESYNAIVEAVTAENRLKGFPQ